MHWVIVSTTNSKQKEFWEQKRSFIEAKILVVEEAWEGGAGNGLGTLYSFDVACRLYKIDLLQKLREGDTVAIYHTAGKGQRLYPLAGAEAGGKCAVELPGSTLLEAVIRQTTPLASSCKGRISIFWGDQLFFSSEELLFSSSEVAIFVKKIPFPSETLFQDLQLERYGLLVKSTSQVILLEKMDYSTFSHMAENLAIDVKEGAWISFGSFSLSYEMFYALLQEFALDIAEKKGKLDTDPHFWMPLCLERETYLQLVNAPPLLYDRMQRVKEHFAKKPLLGITNVGEDALWLDFGTVASFYKSLSTLLEDSFFGKRMREFFDLTLSQDHSILYRSQVGKGSVKNSILIDVQAEEIDVENCILIHVKAKKLQGREALFYNMQQEEIALHAGEVVAGVPIAGELKPFYTHLTNDGKRDWQKRLPGNLYTYEEMSKRAIE